MEQNKKEPTIKDKKPNKNNEIMPLILYFKRKFIYLLFYKKNKELSNENFLKEIINENILLKGKVSEKDTENMNLKNISIFIIKKKWISSTRNEILKNEIKKNNALNEYTFQSKNLIYKIKDMEKEKENVN